LLQELLHERGVIFLWCVFENPLERLLAFLLDVGCGDDDALPLRCVAGEFVLQEIVLVGLAVRFVRRLW
jgi:hypothetical protein